MKVYVAGPMRGIPEFNFPEFATATTILREHGHEVISPAEHDLENGFDPAGMTGVEDLTGLFDLRAALAWDLQQVSTCDGVFLLPGWEKSSGARAEIACAAALGLLARTYDQEWQPAADVLSAPANATSSEVRVTDPTTGGQKGTKEVRMDLVPVYPLTELARLYGRGAAKYEDRNWERGYRWSLSYAALLRHLTQWWGGEDKDPEMGTSHLASVAWHAFALAQFEVAHPDLDDRPGRVTPPTR